MQLQKLLSTDEEQAVSPVIGVILMVAITVILAAVIASFVLGLGDSQEVAPTATFDFDYDTDGPNVTVTHTGGDNVISENLYIRGQDIDTSTSDTELWGSNDDRWGGSNSTTIDGKNAVTSGDSANIEVDGSSYVIRVVWESAEGSSSSELASDSGPDA